MFIFTNTTWAGPMVEPSADAVHAGLIAAFWLALVVIGVFTPLFVWVVRRNSRALREAREQAEEHRSLP